MVVIWARWKLKVKRERAYLHSSKKIFINPKPSDHRILRFEMKKLRLENKYRIPPGLCSKPVRSNNGANFSRLNEASIQNDSKLILKIGENFLGLKNCWTWVGDTS